MNKGSTDSPFKDQWKEQVSQFVEEKLDERDEAKARKDSKKAEQRRATDEQQKAIGHLEEWTIMESEGSSRVDSYRS